MNSFFLLLSMIFMAGTGLAAVDGLLAKDGSRLCKVELKCLVCGALCLACFLGFLVCGGI